MGVGSVRGRGGGRGGVVEEVEGWRSVLWGKGRRAGKVRGGGVERGRGVGEGSWKKWRGSDRYCGGRGGGLVRDGGVGGDCVNK